MGKAGWRFAGLEEQEQFWVRTSHAGPWQSRWEIKAGPAMG